MNNISQALIKQFQNHRIVFWYDEKVELTQQFNELDMDGVEKVHVQGNEFEVKHLVVKQHPNKKFLLYFTSPKPLNEENWLLDLELAYHVFHTDKEAMFLQEIGLGYHLKELVAEHVKFFEAKERRLKLKELLGEGDEHRDIRYKMLAVLFDTENISLVTFIHAHGSAFADENEKYDKELERYNLANFYWSEVTRKYNYQNEEPSIYDFLLEVFEHNFSLGKKGTVSKETRLILSLWRDTIKYRDSFNVVSGKIAEDIDLETKLNDANLDQTIGDELFRLSDLKVIHELVHQISAETISYDKVSQYIKQRENKFWFNEFSAFYQSLQEASSLIALIRKYSSTQYESLSEGVEHYTKLLYRVDSVYRKFIFSYRRTNQNKILSELFDQVEKVYSNDWLLQFTNNWQQVIDALDSWPTGVRHSQQQFFNVHVKPFIQKKMRLFVIISDAFRYECGAELSKRLQSENRYESSIDYMLSSLPSYTQLGMASMLPHKNLAIQDKSDIVVADNMSSSGIQGRSNVLLSNSGVDATAIKAEDFMKMNSAKEGRAFVKKYDLIYIYHNRIDKVGDDKTSEDKVFEAVEDELQFLMDLMKKIANMNGSNMMVTSDHGFLYQHSELSESDFSVSNHQGEVWKENRRFVIGKNLQGDNSTKLFKGKDLNLSTDIDLLFPKSINRLRVKGAGSRFIHGGTSLQEIVVPLVNVTKKKKDTVSQVDIDIIKSTDRITTNILSVSFIQSNLVTEQVLPRVLRTAIYAEDGELLSDQFKYNFDIAEGSERMREVKHRFQLSSKASSKYKNQRVRLVLEEPVEGTTKWREYKDYFYTLNISFTNDFDGI
ncbi:BREX-1 system phosphatase PglZ type A [Saccharicrinis sp. GN24d3]|uniref:BREX-1 system phosphatase PglZ type A n=1 Tax=Saccharicrinis sp. GN24d3 TaxID=3458416 RepID=UPI00403571B3